MDFLKPAPSAYHPPWYTYESQLSTVVRGSALWTPGPYKEVDGSVSPIRLADVGYMMDGRFVTLFNAGEISGSAPNARNVFPNEKLRDPIFNARTVDRFTTSSVEASITNISADKNTGNVQISANLSSRYGPGAAMILPGTDGTVKMESYDLRHQPFYSDYCFKHCESWLQTAAHTAAKHVELKDLIFVTGIDMVTSWALFAFPSSSDGCSVGITAGPTTMVATRNDSETSTPLNCPPIMNFGPVDRQTPGSLDQCVVIRRFKIHRRIEKLKWHMSRGLRKVMSKRTEFADAMIIDGHPEEAEAEHAEDDSEASDDDEKKGRIRKQRRTKPFHVSPTDSEGSDLPSDRRGGGGAGGAGSSGKNGHSSTGLPPGNGGGRRDTGSGTSGSDGSNGHRNHVSTYTLSDNDGEDTPPTSESDDYFDSDSDDESVDSERLEPLDALLEYILEACPSAGYAGAGDHDLIPFQSMLNDWDSFPARLRTMKPEVHLQPNGLALLKDSVYYTTTVHELQGELGEFTDSFTSQRYVETSKSPEEPNTATVNPEPRTTGPQFPKKAPELHEQLETSHRERISGAKRRERWNYTRPCMPCRESHLRCAISPQYSPSCRRCREDGHRCCCPVSKTHCDGQVSPLPPFASSSGLYPTLMEASSSPRPLPAYVFTHNDPERLRYQLGETSNSAHTQNMLPRSSNFAVARAATPVMVVLVPTGDITSSSSMHACWRMIATRNITRSQSPRSSSARLLEEVGPLCTRQQDQLNIDHIAQQDVLTTAWPDRPSRPPTSPSASINSPNLSPIPTIDNNNTFSNNGQHVWPVLNAFGPSHSPSHQAVFPTTRLRSPKLPSIQNSPSINGSLNFIPTRLRSRLFYPVVQSISELSAHHGTHRRLRRPTVPHFDNTPSESSADSTKPPSYQNLVSNYLDMLSKKPEDTTMSASYFSTAEPSPDIQTVPQHVMDSLLEHTSTPEWNDYLTSPFDESPLKAILETPIIDGKVPKMLPRSPTIPRFCGVSEYFDRSCLISPWMYHGEVTDYLARKPYCDRFSFMSDVASGLAYLHSSGVLHGDLRGANILVSPNGTPCIADFGPSQLPDILESTLGAATESIGTPRWQAPEVLRELDGGETTRSRQQSDVFSFGALVFELLEGNRQATWSAHFPDCLMFSAAGQPWMVLVAGGGFEDIWGHRLDRDISCRERCLYSHCSSIPKLIRGEPPLLEDRGDGGSVKDIMNEDQDQIPERPSGHC